MAGVVGLGGGVGVVRGGMEDAGHMMKAVEWAERSSGATAPHPKAGCVIVRGRRIVGGGGLYGEGARSAELQAVEEAGEHARGATAFLNLEPGDCDGDDAAVAALVRGGVERVVIGMRHPLPHFRGKAIAALRRAGARVEVGGEGFGDGGAIAAALKACEFANAPLLYRARHNLPMSTLKYAMTLDGKIAASSGHAAWVSSAVSRERVFRTRAESDAVIVGGNTVRSDNPSLTTRQEGGHQPDRIVMSRALDLPREANLWDVSKVHTIVMTQKGANQEFQKYLASRGVEVVEFDFLSPRAVMEHCYLRGYLSVLWECGGTLSAPAIQGSVIHKVLAFIAPKIVGGLKAPTPVGELGMVQMTQALKLSDVTFEQTGPDMLVTGYLQPIPGVSLSGNDELTSTSGADFAEVASKPSVIRFNKPWDRYGALSNRSYHPITLPDCDGKSVVWSSVEHYYQASKFAGVNDPLAVQCKAEIQATECPEEAARLGEALSRQRPDLVRKDWDIVKLQVIRTALEAKFLAYPALKSFLLSTEGSVLVESSQNDSFWGASKNGVGLNHLGRLLMDLRAELRGGPFTDGLVNGHSTKSSVNGSKDFFGIHRQQVAS
ncbi:hypothetical protein M758_7G079800 [Ceratodon purpureus]|uniref:5-amino-6-(5-phosphoribosylamino)uracil reductase n=1 Tax=Ceratodon purpureus TaxID=3225 RepID=A0A8T0H7H9_CERPU|nr:hypothetical protein KC19_7G084700 [Ceratodon purpureus]KAG0610631.1 hypothetical protein M758_7G079800 [Ceratodon purpureus]